MHIIFISSKIVTKDFWTYPPVNNLTERKKHTKVNSVQKCVTSLYVCNKFWPQLSGAGSERRI